LLIRAGNGIGGRSFVCSRCRAMACSRHRACGRKTARCSCSVVCVVVATRSVRTRFASNDRWSTKPQRNATRCATHRASCHTPNNAANAAHAVAAVCDAGARTTASRRIRCSQSSSFVRTPVARLVLLRTFVVIVVVVFLLVCRHHRAE